MVQAFDTGSGALLGSVTLSGTPAGLAQFGGGTRLAVGTSDTAELVVLNASTLEVVGTAAVPPASQEVCAVSVEGGKSVLVATSSLSETVAFIDADSMQVLKTLDAAGAGQAEASASDLVLVSRSPVGLDALVVDHSSAWFGE